MPRERRSFTREYKLEAVRLVTEGGRQLSQVARDLGVRADLLRHWKRRLEAEGAVRPRPAASLEEENRRLQRELAVLRQERDFLKKAAAFFAKGSGGGTP
jgi:transposase